MHTASTSMLFLAVMFACWGCMLPSRQFRGPQSAQQQRYEATQFDPYTDNDAGPEIVGGRPRQYDRPFSEPTRATTFQNPNWPFAK